MFLDTRENLDFQDMEGQELLARKEIAAMAALMDCLALMDKKEILALQASQVLKVIRVVLVSRVFQALLVWMDNRDLKVSLVLEVWMVKRVLRENLDASENGVSVVKRVTWVHPELQDTWD